jgi:hypothetical protein
MRLLNTPRRPRARRLACEPLEPRALLHAAPSIGRLAVVDAPRRAAVVALPVDADRFQFARDGTIRLELQIAPDDSDLLPGRVAIRNAAGRVLPVRLERSGADAHALLHLRPGHYELLVHARGSAVGAFRVTAHLAGDVDGGRDVNRADLDAIRAGFGARRGGRGPVAYDPHLDVNHDGRVGPRDLRLARLNLNAADTQLPIVISNDTGKFLSSDVHVAVYARNSALVDATNPSGWAYADATGAWHSVFGLTQVPTFPLSRLHGGVLNLVTYSAGQPIDIESGQIYFGLGSAIVLPVNVGVTSVTVTAGGSGYGASPPASFVTFSGGGGANTTATAVVAAGAVTQVNVTNTGNGYTSAPTVSFVGDLGSGASATATVQVLGVAAPNPSSSTDPNNPLPWTFVEFSRPAATPLTLNLDISQVDQFSVPLTLGTEPGAPGFPRGVGITGTQPSVVAAFSDYIHAIAAHAPSALDFLDTLQPIGSGAAAPTRILAPKDLIPLYAQLGQSTALSTYFDAALADLFTVGNTIDGLTATYAGTTHTFNGTVQSSGGLTSILFTDTADPSLQLTVYSPLTPPSWVANPYGASQMVFACNGVFADNTQQYPTDARKSSLLGTLENQLVSALNRGVASLPTSQWLTVADQYQPTATANFYAGFFHQATVSIGGFAYGFAFDDQGAQSTDMSVVTPKGICIRLGWDRPILPACDLPA